MKLNQLIIIFLLFLTSCQTVKWAEKGMYKRYKKFPEVGAQFCGTYFKPIDSVSIITEFLPGEVIHDTPFVLINWDSVKNSHLTGTGKVPCPPTTKRVDTFRSIKKEVVTDKAKEYLLTKSLDSIKEEFKEFEIQTAADYVTLKEKTNNKIKNKNKQLTITYSLLSILLIITVVKFYLKRYTKLI